MNAQSMTADQFAKRLATLCLRSGMAGFPKDETDQHILLKSAVLLLGQSGSFTEKEINAKLDEWVQEIGGMKEIDRVTLRRRLVDTGYLTRTSDGARYEVAQPGPRPGLFDAAVESLDVRQVIANAREEMARKKREYLEKSKGA